MKSQTVVTIVLRLLVKYATSTKLLVSTLGGASLNSLLNFKTRPDGSQVRLGYR